MMDYVMSEKFGINWQKMPIKRVTYLWEIMQALNKKQELENRKSN